MSTIYKVLDLDRDQITLVKYPLKHHEVIEELEVPEGEDIDEFIQNELESVDLGSMCERRTRY